MLVGMASVLCTIWTFTWLGVALLTVLPAFVAPQGVRLAWVSLGSAVLCVAGIFGGAAIRRAERTLDGPAGDRRGFDVLPPPEGPSVKGPS